MLLLSLDPRSRTPLFRQVLDGIRERIAAGDLRPGESLPSTRRLAQGLGLHRSTVAVAYQELWSLGFVDLRPGSRPRVRERTQLVSPARPAEAGLLDWRAVASHRSNEVARLYRRLGAAAGAGAAPVVSFRSLEMDPRLYPVEGLRSCLRRALAREGAALLGYGDPAGHARLRATIAARLRRHGICATAGEILLTNGSQQAIDLVFRMIAAPGRSVAVEAPTYDSMLPLLRLYGLRPIEIPLRHDGLDLAALEQALRRERPTLVYTMPSFQNPTGVCTSQAHREALLALCQRRRVPILEDGFEEEMKYAGRAVLPLKSMDRRQLVIYCGTFSKVLFPGLRIGWVAADRRCIERLTAIRRFGEVAPAGLLQAALQEFCEDGSYDRHLARMHRVYRRRMQVALRALRQHVDPAWAGWAEPRGGYLIWLRLKRWPARAGDVDEVLAAHGVQAAPGRQFFCSKRREGYLRLSVSALDEGEIVEGVVRLARALRAAHAGTGGAA